MKETNNNNNNKKNSWLQSWLPFFQEITSSDAMMIKSKFHHTKSNNSNLPFGVFAMVVAWVHFSSVAQSCLTLCDPMNRSMPGLHVHHQPPVHPNSYTLSQWCHPTIWSSVIPFSSCPQSFSASGSFQMSQLFASGGQSIGVSASTSVLPVNTQDWSPLGWTGSISLQSKGLSTVFSNTTVQKHQFFSTQLSS